MCFGCGSGFGFHSGVLANSQLLNEPEVVGQASQAMNRLSSRPAANRHASRRSWLVAFGNFLFATSTNSSRSLLGVE